VDTPELVQPMELDRAQTNKERKRALNKAYREKNADCIKAKNKAYAEQNVDSIKANKKAYRKKNADSIKAKDKANREQWDAANIGRRKEINKQWRSVNIEKQKAYSHKQYAANPEKCKAYARAWKLRNHGCIRCIKWPVDQQVGIPHYDCYCFRCFCDEFPHDERVKTKARVELRVRAYLNIHFADFVHDRPLETAHCVCSHRRRIDHRRLIGNTLLCVETDENFHKYYDPDDEDARYHDVIMAFGGKLCFVRFNPHKFNLDDRYDHGPPLAERLELLHAEITRHVGRLERGENSAYLEVWHLYYPEGTEDYCGETIAPEGL
jgi:hypothetical protein